MNETAKATAAYAAGLILLGLVMMGISVVAGCSTTNVTNYGGTVTVNQSTPMSLSVPLGDSAIATAKKVP